MSDLEKETEVRVDASFPGLGERLAAFGYDYLLISLYLIVLGAVTTLLMKSAGDGAWNSFFSSPVRADLMAFATTILPISIYFALCESSGSMASWGKKKRGIIVTGLGGHRLTRGRAFSRALLKFFPWQVAHTCLFNIPGWPMNATSPPSWVTVGLAGVWVLGGIYLVTLLMSRQNRTLYDRLLGTQVRFLARHRSIPVP